jgi:hypothetical protein
MLMFSFSSCSEMLSAELATPCLVGFVFDCACSKDGIRRVEMDVAGVVFVRGNLEYEEALPIGVGVTDVRCLTGGGPIEPSTPRAGLEGADAGPVAALFTRILFPRVVDAESDSVDGFRCLVVVLAFDMADEGREEGRGTLGVVNALGSR